MVTETPRTVVRGVSTVDREDKNVQSNVKLAKCKQKVVEIFVGCLYYDCKKTAYKWNEK